MGLVSLSLSLSLSLSFSIDARGLFIAALKVAFKRPGRGGCWVGLRIFLSIADTGQKVKSEMLKELSESITRQGTLIAGRLDVSRAWWTNQPPNCR
jgi:hypothetical protein